MYINFFYNTYKKFIYKFNMESDYNIHAIKKNANYHIGVIYRCHFGTSAEPSLFEPSISLPLPFSYGKLQIGLEVAHDQENIVEDGCE